MIHILLKEGSDIKPVAVHRESDGEGGDGGQRAGRG
jgi:hypothetical protein